MQTSLLCLLHYQHEVSVFRAALLARMSSDQRLVSDPRKTGRLSFYLPTKMSRLKCLWVSSALLSTEKNLPRIPQKLSFLSRNAKGRSLLDLCVAGVSFTPLGLNFLRQKKLLKMMTQIKYLAHVQPDPDSSISRHRNLWQTCCLREQHPISWDDPVT